MKKNTKIMIACVSCVAVLAAGMAVVLNLPSENPETKEASTGESILLFDKTDLDVEEITVKNSSGQYELLGYSYRDEDDLNSSSASKESVSKAENSDSSSSAAESSEKKNERSDGDELKIIYTMQDHESEMLSKSLTDMLVNQCSYMAATQIVDKSGKRYAEYGLDSPQATVSVVYSDNSKVKMELGKDAPDQKGVYLKMDGDKYVYLVQSSMVDTFFYEKMQMFDRTVSVKYNSDYTISTVAVSGERFKEEIAITSEENKMNFCPYIMTKPRRELCDDSFVQSFGESVYGIEGTKVIAVEVKESDLNKYGLDKPYMKVNVTASDDSFVGVLVSKKDADGNCYIMEQGGTKVYQMAAEDLLWYDAQYGDFIKQEIVNPYQPNLKSIDISYKGKDYHYDYKRETVINKKYEETTKTDIFYQGARINAQNVSLFNNNVSGILRNLSAPKTLDGCKELFRIQYTYDVETKDNSDTLILYTTSDDQCVAVLNGNIEAYTNKEYVQELLKQVALIPTKDDLTVLYDNAANNEYTETSESESDT